MKITTKKMRIVPCGAVALHNGESAVAGEAAELLNMRERKESLEVVGEPVALSQDLMAGDEVLLVDDDRTLVLRDPIQTGLPAEGDRVSPVILL